MTAISCRSPVVIHATSTSANIWIFFVVYLFVVFWFVFCFFFYLFIYLFFEQGKFDNAVEILKPARYKVVTIGGSNAQVSRKSLWIDGFQ